MASFNAADPEILQDFIIESTELLDRLDQDLIALEKAPSDPELLNSAFRALHTIKGSGSFLGIAPLTEFAHAAEDALNALRKGQAKVTASGMDALLAAADIVRSQIDELRDGQMPSPGPEDLIARLHQIATGEAEAQEAAPADASPVPEAETEAEDRLNLSASKLDILPFMVEDMNHTLQELAGLLEQLHSSEERGAVARKMADQTDELIRASEFFEVEAMTREMHALHAFAEAAPGMDPARLAEATPRASAILHVLQQRADALSDLRLVNLEMQPLLDRLDRLCRGESVDEATALAPNASHEQILAHDGIGGTSQASDDEETDPSEPSLQVAAADQAERPEKASASASAPSGEQTIRVDVRRLEMLLNLVGELVLQKNRVLTLTQRLEHEEVDHDLMEHLTQTASDLERVTGDLQMGVMKTRLQPLNKVFSRYPRLIRDLSRATGKQMELKITGGDTEVDKSVLEGLADPLVHLLRNSADHGLETPEERTAAGKAATGTIHLNAKHEGNQVLVQIIDDGRGMDPKKIGRRALERGLVRPEELETMSESDILQFIFAPGFSTAEKVSDISGRGVGMDVVRNNITHLNGIIDLDSKLGQGTTVSLKIPLTVAIMPAMMVGVGAKETYAIPLSNIIEIIRPENTQIRTIHGQPVVQVRGQVLPLLDLNARFDGVADQSQARFAVVVGLGEQRVALLVNRLIGQQEIVIKPLDDMFDRTGAASGATVREDGSVSLILDIASLLKTVGRNASRAA